MRAASCRSRPGTRSILGQARAVALPSAAGSDHGPRIPDARGTHAEPEQHQMGAGAARGGWRRFRVLRRWRRDARGLTARCLDPRGRRGRARLPRSELRDRDQARCGGVDRARGADRRGDQGLGGEWRVRTRSRLGAARVGVRRRARGPHPHDPRARRPTLRRAGRGRDPIRRLPGWSRRGAAPGARARAVRARRSPSRWGSRRASRKRSRRSDPSLRSDRGGRGEVRCVLRAGKGSV